jgi:hypothetical protein
VGRCRDRTRNCCVALTLTIGLLSCSFQWNHGILFVASLLFLYVCLYVERCYFILDICAGDDLWPLLEFRIWRYAERKHNRTVGGHCLTEQAVLQSIRKKCLFTKQGRTFPDLFLSSNSYLFYWNNVIFDNISMKCKKIIYAFMWPPKKVLDSVADLHDFCLNPAFQIVLIRILSYINIVPGSGSWP